MIVSTMFVLLSLAQFSCSHCLISSISCLGNEASALLETSVLETSRSWLDRALSHKGDRYEDGIHLQHNKRVIVPRHEADETELLVVENSTSSEGATTDNSSDNDEPATGGPPKKKLAGVIEL